MHTIERELIKVTAFKARKFSDRQDYLKSILNAVVKLTEDDFNNLTDAAAVWANAAVEAHNIKAKELPDFDEVPLDEEDDTETDEAEAEETTEAEDDAEGVAEAPDDEATEDEPDEEASEDEVSQDQEANEEPEPEAKPKRNKKKPPAAKKAEARTSAATTAILAVPKSVSKLNRGSDEDVVFDKWGAMEGSKNSQALALFEKGATTREVSEEIGGTYYNILKKMVQNGHKLNKEGAVMTLVHKDANKPPPKKKK